ncbi:MAG TPA: hypothetical protein VLL94_11965, partial [Nitrospiraceae bacterium]|nr:hypothetical protein [Nitrospiraceae bacterium]
MDHTTEPAYGLWSLVIINSLVFMIFAFSFAKPQSSRDWFRLSDAVGPTLLLHGLPRRFAEVGDVHPD